MSKLRNSLLATIPLAAAAYFWFGRETPHAVAEAHVARATADAAAARYQSLAKGTRGEQIAEAAAALDVTRADADAARVALDQTILRAPHDGIVLRRLAEIGTLVTTMNPAT